jgi:hypothetical protein
MAAGSCDEWEVRGEGWHVGSAAPARPKRRRAISHAKRWAAYQRAVSQRLRSRKTNDWLFRKEKRAGHSTRRDPFGVDKVVSKAVGGVARVSFVGEGPRYLFGILCF